MCSLRLSYVSLVKAMGNIDIDIGLIPLLVVKFSYALIAY